MKRIFVPICMLLLTALLLPGSSFAGGFGFYGDFGSGSGEAEYDEWNDDDEYDIDTDFVGFGFQLETNPVTRGKVFSYRFQIGYESRDIDNDGNTTFELGGVLLNNTFAFGGNVSDGVRLWIGPQIALGIYAGETEEYYGDEMSYVGALCGIGIAGGANFALGNEAVIITTTVGARRFGMAGTVEYYDEDDDHTMSGSEFFVSIGVMF